MTFSRELTLRVISFNGQRLAEGQVATLPAGAGSIGSGANCSLVLSSPDLYVPYICAFIRVIEDSVYLELISDQISVMIGTATVADGKPVELTSGAVATIGLWDIEVTYSQKIAPDARPKVQMKERDIWEAPDMGGDRVMNMYMHPGLDHPSVVHRVALGVSAPRHVKPTDSFLVSFVAFPDGLAAKVLELLKSQSPGNLNLLGKRNCNWRAGATVDVSIIAPDFHTDTATQAVVWNGGIQIVDFVLSVSTAMPSGGAKPVTLVVHLSDLEVARISVMVRIEAQISDGERQFSAKRSWKTGFVSYSKLDRPAVLQLLGAIETATGADLFVDCLDIRGSDYWKPALEREIDNSDQFLLFWSSNAQRSKWVEWEWRRALQTKSLSRFQVHCLEQDVSPPQELSDLHFSNRYIASLRQRGLTPRSS
jgi:hypothetical protein